MGFLDEQGIKAILLDIDGTLYPKRMLDWRMFKTAFPSIRLGLLYNAVRHEYRIRQELVATDPADRSGLLKRQAALALELAGKPVTPSRLERMAERIDRQFYRRWERSFRSVKPYRGVRESLVAAKGHGLFVGVFSDFPVAGKLQALGLDDLVDLALSSEDSGYLKPSGKAFEYLLSRVSVSPDEILFVGDSYDKDVIGAKQAGMHACLVSASSRQFPQADVVIRSWKDFPAKMF
jgi:putative hydrolase of the HAD superfamily